MMKAAHEPRVRETIEQAFLDAEANRMAIAVQGFARARAEALRLCDQKQLTTTINDTLARAVKERETCKAQLADKTGTTRKLLIMSDSLGLPRAGEGATTEATYSGLINAKYPDLAVHSHCQRYYTTKDARAALQADPTLGTGSDVIIHLGLNDCANRMFLENERLSLSLMSDETRERIVAFSRTYRKYIIALLPPNHYVPPDAFRQNLDAMVSLLKAREAKRILLATIILPPTRSWGGTPWMTRNFTTYNLALMETAYQHKVTLLDIDRFVWERQHDGVLLPDGMHLSDEGHQLFADRCDPYIK